MKRLPFTLKAWPVITAATLLLCFLTQTVAGWLGYDLPDQANLMLVKQMAGLNWRFFLLCVQVLLIMPAIEEVVFRLPVRWLGHPVWWAVSSALFSAAHYAYQPFPDSAFIALFFFGLAQCWLYRKTARIWCPILNHALFNAANLILLFILPPNPPTP